MIAGPPIERVRDLTPEAFRTHYLLPRRPVILEGAVDHWDARTWTPSYFKERFGDRKVTVEEDAENEVEMTLGAYIDTLAESAGPSAEPGPYLRGVMLVEVFPELLSAFDILPHFRPNWLARPGLGPFVPSSVQVWADLFIGPPGAGFPNLHYDAYMTHNWFCQVYGTKHFWTFAQEQRPHLYPDPDYLSESMLGGVFPPDPQEFPDTRRAVCVEFDLEPGELLFIPAGLWHTTRMETVSISLSGNFLNATNFADFEREIEAHGDECSFDWLKKRWFRRWMRRTNRIVDAVVGPPTAPFRYRTE